MTAHTSRIDTSRAGTATLPPSQRTIIAIDGGNSKTDVVLIDGTGTVLRRARSGPFIPHLVGAVEAVDSVGDAIDDVLGATVSGRADRIDAYLANADLAVEEAALHAAFVAHGWADEVVVENDTLALLRAGTRSPDAVAIVCGAGINAVGVAADGSRVRYPALGRTTGDWGGGLSLAKEALWATARHEDGRGPQTALTAAVARHFDLPTAIAVSEALHLGTIDRDRVHELVPVLFEVAATGDPVAAALVHRQADEIVLLARVTLDRLGLLDRPTDIVLGGGILSSSHPLLLDDVLEGLRRDTPHGRPVLLDEVPVVGAALLGLERVWAGHDAAGREAALDRLRTQIGASRG